MQILAQRDRLRRNTPQGGEARKATPSDAQRGVGADDREGEAPYTLKIRSGCDGGGKGALVPLDKSATLATNNDQYLFHPVGTDPYNGCLTCPPSSTLGVNCGLATGRTGVITLEPGVAAREGGHIYEGVSGTLRANAGDNQMAVAYAVENHPADSQAVSFNWQAAAGAGLCVEENCVNPLGCTRVPAVACGINGETAGTLDASYFKGCGERSGVEREVIATYGFDPSADRDVGALFIEECSKTITNGTSPGHHEGAVDGNDRAAFNQGANALYDFEIGEHGVNSTIVAKGPSAVAYKEPPHYIVRRLTPTECARLQGFPDRWGDINTKDSMTDEDFRFWLEVRQTYDRINGRAAKDYTPTQVLTWYNKLHTDSAEYKMWGNGIALPCALYVMEGIEEAYHEV